MAECKQCGEPLVGGRPNRRFCDSACQRAYHSAAWRLANPKSPRAALKTSAVAERNVLLVSMDLLKRWEGAQLYRALFPGQDTDLIVMHRNFPGIAHRIEVVTGSRTAKGKVTHAKRDEAKFDVLAVVMQNDDIVYEPPYGEWPMIWGVQ
jgi:hypothetical protein